MSSVCDIAESCNKIDWPGNMEGGGNRLKEFSGDCQWKQQVSVSTYISSRTACYFQPSCLFR